MKKLRSNLLSIALLIGISAGAAARALPPYHSCNVANTRMELELLCPTGLPICCKFMAWTYFPDSGEIFYQGQIHPGTFTPFD
jgi:hypothetical protein